MFRKYLARMTALIVQWLFYAPRAYQTAPATAATLTGMSATQLRAQAWDKTLREDTTLDDVFSRLTQSVDIRMSRIEIPNAIWMQFENPSTENHKLTFSMSTPLKKAFRMGTDEDMLGQGEDLDLYHLTIRYNEIKKAVAARGWGIDFNDLSATGIYGTITPKLQKAYKELKGRRTREALMLTVAEELTKAPISLKQQFNPNIFIPNLALGSMPVWDVTELTNTAGAEDALGFKTHTFSGANSYVESIAAKMLTASGTGSASLAYLTVENLADLELHCRTTIGMPKVQIGNQEGYVFVCPSVVAAYLACPAVTGSMGSYWVQMAALSTEEQSIPGMLGRYRSLWLIEDERGPTLTVSGSSGTYTLQPGFTQHGNNDDRNANPWCNTSGSQNYVFEVGWVLGAGGLAEWLVNDIAYAKETTEFGKLLEKGSWMNCGIQLARFDKDTPDDVNDSAGTGLGKTLIHKGSCMVLMSRRPVTTIRT
jgi:hypothetical protein